MKQITKQLVQSWVPTRAKDVYKGQLGHVLCIGGNHQMGGAIILAASAALYSGAGLVSVASDPVNLHALHSRVPEVMFLDMYDEEELLHYLSKVDTVVIGPGLGRGQQALAVFTNVMTSLQTFQSVIIDADAIYLYKHYLKHASKAKQIFTPHLGEWEVLSGLSKEQEKPSLNKIEQDKLASTIVLKKSRTEIYFDNEVWQNTTGNPSMATGGMGDTLAGIIAGLLGQFSNKNTAVLSGVFLHGLTADWLSNEHYVTLPQEVICQLPQTMKALHDKGGEGF